MAIYKYTPITTPGPNGCTYHANTGGTECVEVARLDGDIYIFVPDGEQLPEQPEGIVLDLVELTSELKAKLKENSRRCQIIFERMQEKIRASYSLEDEQYYSRIGVGAALGVYQFQPGEQEELLAFGEFVESVREWGRTEREKLGLS